MMDRRNNTCGAHTVQGVRTGASALTEPASVSVRVAAERRRFALRRATPQDRIREQAR
jgi:hypothetical protein